MKIYSPILFAFLLLPILVTAQVGGRNAFPFLDLNFNARQASLGGSLLSVKDNDVNIGVLNPAALNEEMHKRVSFSHAFHAGKINYGQFSYVHALNEKNFISGFIQYMGYGNMERRATNGELLGEFAPFEYALGAGYGRKINEVLSVGANLRLIGSHIDTYSSYGASLDLAGMYYSKNKTFGVTAMVRHAGVQFNSYVTDRDPLPTNFQIGLGYKLPHAPFRFSILMHHLNKWDLTYVDPGATSTYDPLTGEWVEPKLPGFFEKLANHFTYQIEVNAGKMVHLRAAFDYYRRQSMKLESRPGAAGFSFGVGLHFKRFALDYGLALYSRAGMNNVLTFSMNLQKVKI